MRTLIPLLLVSLLVCAGCKNSTQDTGNPNKQPTTNLWLMPAPDSMIAAGHSRQIIHWSGNDPDGIVNGFLVAAGRLVPDVRNPVYGDSIDWHWTAAKESLIAFPLLKAADTFQVAVRAVDNTFPVIIPEQACIHVAGKRMYWDVNSNHIFDSSDVWLDRLPSAADPKGAVLNFPVLNQPPSLDFFNPYDSTSALVQPETTFTAASFSWRGTDPDGDNTIKQYELALNDTTDASRRLIVPASIKLVSLVVPRSVTDPLHLARNQSADKPADVWGGTFSGNHSIIGSLPHLKLNAKNIFYIRARDIADSASPFIRMPSTQDPTAYWFVKCPIGHALIVNDYLGSGKDTVVKFYASTLNQVGYPDAELIDIVRGVTLSDKSNSIAGVMVPKLIDPAFSFTLHLFDLVLWYTDEVPSLPVAQYSLYQYVRDPSHRGKVIFSTQFAILSDPRGALTDFAPLDSICSVNLRIGFLTPTIGAASIPPGYQLLPDDPACPTMTFNPKSSLHSVFFRPIYRRADAKYILRLQADAEKPLQYAPSAVQWDLNAVAGSGSNLWAAGLHGCILHSADNGATWKNQAGSPDQTLKAMQFLDDSRGMIVGLNGTILRTSNGGAAWLQKINVTQANLNGLCLLDQNIGYACGSDGKVFRTGDGGDNWAVQQTPRTKNLRAVAFGSPNLGVAVGDSGIMHYTTDGGQNWNLVARITNKHLNACRFLSHSHVLIVGNAGTYYNSHDGGQSWTTGGSFTTRDLNTLAFADSLNGWCAGSNGSVYHTTDGGTIWAQQKTGIEYTNTPLAQVFEGLALYGSSGVAGVGTGGLIMGSSNAGLQWVTQPFYDPSSSQYGLHVGVVDGPGQDGNRSFAFIGLPLHVLNGDGTNVYQLLQFLLTNEFGLIAP